MAKYTPNSPNNGFLTATEVTSELNAIKSAIDDQLDRKGASPNNMETDIDMNSKRILNLPDALSESEPLTLRQFNNQAQGVQTIGTLKSKATATDGQTVFVTPSYVVGANNLHVYVNGVRQASDAYTEDNKNQITFTSALQAGDIVEFVVNELPENAGTLASINVTHEGTTVAATLDKTAKFYDTVAEATADASLKVGDVVVIKERANAQFDVVAATTVTPNTYDIIAGVADTSIALKLRTAGVANVKQFGAAGDGATNDAAAILAAINSGLPVYLPQGTYEISGNVAPSVGFTMFGDGDGSLLQNGGIIVDADNISCTFRDFKIDRGDANSVAIDVGVTNTNTVNNYECHNVTVVNARRGINGNCEVLRGRFFNNTVKNIGGATIAQTSGFLIGTGADIAVQSTDLVFKGNTVENVTASGTTEAHAFLISGDGIVIEGNYCKNISNVSGGNGGEAIYTNGINTKVVNNTIIDGNNGQGAITCKGFDPASPSNPKSKDVIVANNTIEFTSATTLTNRIGIGAYARSMLVEGNILRNCSGEAAIHSVGQRAEHYIARNKIIDCKATAVIQVDSEIDSKHYTIRDNEIINFDMTGRPSTTALINFNIDGTTENVVVSGNSATFTTPSPSVSNIYFVGFTVESGEQVNNIAITNNDVVFPSTGVSNPSHANFSALSGALSYGSVFLSGNSSNYKKGPTANSLATFTTFVDANNSWNVASTFYSGSSYLGVQGTIVINDSAAVGQQQGWVCTATGRPGTWAAMPNL